MLKCRAGTFACTIWLCLGLPAPTLALVTATCVPSSTPTSPSPPPSSLSYPACFPAPTQPSLQRGTARPQQLSLEGSFARCSASPGWPSPTWALRDPPGPLAGSLGWAGRGLPEVTQLISARAALGGAGAPPSVLQGCSGDHGIAPALRAWTGPHWTPGSSGEMQGLGFDRGSGKAKGCLPQSLPSPQIP